MRRDWRQAASLHGLVAALLLSLVALWNGGGIPYPDTYEYLARPANLLEKAAPTLFENDLDRKQPTSAVPSRPADSAAGSREDSGTRFPAGRSPYWGAIAFLLYSIAGFAAIVAANALVLGVTLALSWSRGLGLRFGWPFHATILVLAALTPAGVFVALLTPDVLTPVLIAALALLLARWEVLSGVDRALLVALASLAAVSHDSHLPLAAAVALPGLAALLLVRKRAIVPRMGAALLPLLVGVTASFLLSAVARSQTGHPPQRLPFLLAHMSDIQAAQDYLANACPAAGYEICNHLPQLERGSWIDFLFQTGARGGVFFASPQPVRDRLSEEQGRVLIDAVRADPAGVGGALVADSLQQLVIVDLTEVAPARHIPTLRIVFDADVVEGFAQTRFIQQPALFQSFDQIQSVAVLAGSAALLLLAWQSRKRLTGADRDVGLFVLLVTGGVVANGLICGLAAAPLGRFQARTIFLLLFVACGLLARQRAGKINLAQPEARSGLAVAPSSTTA